MMPIALTLLTLLLQFLLGFGLLSLFRLTLGKVERISLSILMGLAGSTVLLFLMECCRIPLREFIFLPSLAALGFGLQFIGQNGRAAWSNFLQGWSFRISAYEWMLLALIVARLGVGAWRAWYQPMIPRDAVMGMDLAAKYAVREGHFVSSLFSSPITGPELSNQPFYAPFTSFSTVIYRMTGTMFGSFWLIPLVWSFCGLLYAHIRKISHPIVAGLLMLLFLAAPEVFSYTFLLLTDFANMAFLVSSVIVLLMAMEAQEAERGRTWMLASILMGFACWSRSDTALHVMAITPWLIAFGWREGPHLMARRVGSFAGISFLLFAAWSFFFVPMYFTHPPAYDTYPDLFNGSRFIDIAGQLIGRVMVRTEAFGFFFFVTAPFLFLPLIFRDRKGLFLSACFFSVLLGLILIGYVFPDATVTNTLKRGVMKLFAMGMLCVAYSEPVRRLTERLHRWERGGSWKEASSISD